MLSFLSLFRQVSREMFKTVGEASCFNISLPRDLVNDDALKNCLNSIVITCK